MMSASARNESFTVSALEKKLGHVRLQHHHVRAAMVAPEMFAAHAG
jgi:hypothetical protein